VPPLQVALPFIGVGQGVHDEPQLANDESLRQLVPPSALQPCVPAGHAPPPELDAPLDVLAALEEASLVPSSTT
jgi:hypothetical protein